MKVAVAEVNRLNQELKAVTESPIIGAAKVTTPSTKSRTCVTPKPNKCPSKIFSKSDKAQKEVDFWESDDDSLETKPLPAPRKRFKRVLKPPPMDERHHYFMPVGNGWWKKVVPSHQRTQMPIVPDSVHLTSPSFKQDPTDNHNHL